MRFPLPAVIKIASHIAINKLRGSGKFATVLQLEPLHTCNLSCSGCGRIREYPSAISAAMPLADCLAAAAECDAPMVSICGGEPLLYPHFDELVAGLRRQGRIVYVCTNGLLLRRKLLEWYPEGSEDTALSASCAAKRIQPSTFFYWNVHLDGHEELHDSIVERKGVFREAVEGIRLAKSLGYQVSTNTTVYRDTDTSEMPAFFEFLRELGVDAHTISPGYDFDSVKEERLHNPNGSPSSSTEIFLDRKMIVEKFAHAPEWAKKYPLLGTPAYLDFLAGKRDLPCAAWAIPTRNAAGWRSPCYLLCDKHEKSYADLLKNTDWEKYGHSPAAPNGASTPRDQRCENCMTHCGFEPAAALGLSPLKGDLQKNLRWMLLHH